MWTNFIFLSLALILPATNYFTNNMLTQGAAMIEEEEKKVRESSGADCDMLLKNNIEGIIIKWAYQVTSQGRIR